MKFIFSKFQHSFLSALFFLTGYLSYTQPKVDEHFSFLNLLSVFCIFIWWLVGLWALGDFIRRCFQLGPHFLSLAIGAFLFSLFISLWGYVGFAGQKTTYLLWIVIFLCHFLPRYRICEIKPKVLAVWHKLKPYPAFYLLVGFLFLSWMVNLLPNMHWDPLYYHLTAPRLWYLHDKIQFFPDRVITNIASYWEYLYLWPQFLLSSSPDSGLLAAHLFSQWAHFFIGVLGTVILLWETRALWIPENLNLNWMFIAMISALVAYNLHFTMLTAKNDWGIIFWFLTGAFFLWGPKPNLPWAFTFLGLTVAAKMTYAIPVFFMSFIHLYEFRLRPSKTWPVFFFLLPFSLIAGRNLLWFGDPFFPPLSSVAKNSLLGPSWLYGLKVHSFTLPHYDWDFLRHKLGQLFPLPRIFNVVIFLLVIKKLRTTFSSFFLRLFSISLLSLFILIFYGAEKAELRLIGAPVMIIFFAAGTVLGRLLQTIPWPRASQVLGTCLAIYLLFLPHYELQSWRLIWKHASLSEYTLFFPGQRSLFWLRSKISPQEKAYSLNSQKLYYLTDKEFNFIWDDPVLDRQLSGQETLKGMLVILQKHHIRYLTVVNDSIDFFYNPRITKIFFSTAAKEGPEVVPFQIFPGEMVIDIKKLTPN
jgi:hypothetical protein